MEVSGDLWTLVCTTEYKLKKEIVTFFLTIMSLHLSILTFSPRIVFYEFAVSCYKVRTVVYKLEILRNKSEQ